MTCVSCPIDAIFFAKMRATSISDAFILEITHRQLNNFEESSHFKIENHFLYFKERLYVPSDFCLSIF